MKISRVNHTRCAVIADWKEELAAMGILYYNPNEQEKELELSVRVQEELNKNAQGLYSVIAANANYDFINKGNGREIKFCQIASSNFGYLIRALANESTEQIEFLRNLRDQKIKKGKETINGEKLGVYFKEIDDTRRRELIKNLVKTNTRKSFCRTVQNVNLLNVTEKLLWAMCCVKKDELFKKNMGQINDEELRVFIDQLNRDYIKKDQLEHIIQSIECQNVKVQPKQNEIKNVNGNKTTTLLELSNAGHKRKRYIFEFLKDFANGDENEKQKLLCYIKRLIVLFYFGREKYESLKDKTEEISGWGFKFQGLDQDACFSQDIVKIIAEKKKCKDKSERRKIDKKIKEVLRARLNETYKERNQYLKTAAKINLEEYEKASYWLSYIKEKAEQLLEGKNTGQAYLLSRLCDRTWEEWVSFICSKYIDMGKGVYHFAMPDIEEIEKRENIVIGEVAEQYRGGLTSFDYERIKAYENFDREIATYIIFAVSNFSMAVQSEESNCEDILNPVSKENLILRKDMKKRILWFFGGCSTWNHIITDKMYAKKEKCECSRYKKWDCKKCGCGYGNFFEAFQQELSVIRNASFHYTAVQDQTDTSPLIKFLFEQEYNKAGEVIRKKYFSNNLPIFYDVADINSLMEKLYSNPQERQAQIPSFDNIIKRKEFRAFIRDNLCQQIESVVNPDNIDKLYSAMYFVLKEIYYHGFLQSKDLKSFFEKGMEKYKEKEEKTYKREIRNFYDRINEIQKDATFAEICQQIMTDYNIQNNKNMKVDISKFGSSESKKAYGHFPLILRKCIKEGFVQYLTDGDAYKFLTEPKESSNENSGITEYEFCSNWKVGMYKNVKENVGSYADIYAWYVLAHFLNQRQLNQMIGTFRSHIQFLEDIDRRSQNARRSGKHQNGKPCAADAQTEQNRKGYCERENIAKYRRITEVLEFSLLFCGRMSNVLTDYFNDDENLAKEEYAAHLAGYVKYEGKSLSISRADALKAFCERNKIEEGSAIYYDAKNPILNKNIIKAMMYGNAGLLEACVEPIEEGEIGEYHKVKSELKEVFQNKESILCKTDQEKLRQFQNIKNRMELTNLTVYMEILDELMGQLISWAYLRERDLMYFQLGYHYMKLYYGNTIPADDNRRVLKGGGVSIADGAILYQIVAMNSYHLRIYTVDKSNGAVIQNKQSKIGDGVMLFVSMYGINVYYEGLQLFAKRKKLLSGKKNPDSAEKKDYGTVESVMDENVWMRNYIDHFKYYSKSERSMLELYSAMYDRFFAYSSKLHKSVPMVLKNILARHFVIAELDLESGEVSDFGEKAKKSAVISLKNKKKEEQNDALQLQSDCFTYKVWEIKRYKDNSGEQKEKKIETKIKLDARDEFFLRELENILQYCSRQ